MQTAIAFPSLSLRFQEKRREEGEVGIFEWKPFPALLYTHDSISLPSQRAEEKIEREGGRRIFLPLPGRRRAEREKGDFPTERHPQIRQKDVGGT